MNLYIIGPGGERHGPFNSIIAVHHFIASRWPDAEQGVDWKFEGDDEDQIDLITKWAKHNGRSFTAEVRALVAEALSRRTR